MEKDRELSQQMTGRPSPVCGLLLLLAAASAACGPALGGEYDRRRAAALLACEKIDAGETQTGLVMNPDGYRAYYVRSHCVQDAAVQFRDRSLCAQVRRKWSLFSSWGISESNCRKLVDEKAGADRAILSEMKRAYDAGPMRLEALRVERNGNGRDYDLVPAFSGRYPHGYLLSFEIVTPAGAAVPIHSNGYYVDTSSSLRIYVRQAEIRAAFPGFEPGRQYPLRASVVLSVPTGNMDAAWPDDFVERIFPVAQRRQVLTVDAPF